MHVARIVFFLAFASLTCSSQRNGNTHLLLQVRPEAALTIEGGDMVLVKIRLAPGTKAQLAAQDDCTSPPPDAAVITESGVFHLRLKGDGNYACLYTAEKILSVPRPAIPN